MAIVAGATALSYTPSVPRSKHASLLIAVAAGLLWGASPAYAAGETFQVLRINNTVSCVHGGFGMLVERTNLDGGVYTVRTVARAGGKIYMNEAATNSTNGTGGWNLFNSFTYGAVSNPGTWPIPAGKQLRMDFTLERPMGTVLYSWTTVVDGCNTGKILYNARPSADKDKDFVPVPQDRCPKLSAGTLDGCPARSLTIAYDAGADRFFGWLYAKGFPNLFAHRAVTVWKVRAGPDKKVGRARASRRGNYALASADPKGTYYATSAAVGKVPKETSLKLRVR